MEQIRVARSFIAADALAELIGAEYDLAGPVTCKLFSKLLRTQDNDHYLVSTGNGQQYVARVYQCGERLQRQESDYQYELEWLNFLTAKGVRVAHPIVRRDGRYLGSLLAPEGLRYYTLFTLARGSTLSLKSPSQLHTFGAKMAEIHVLSNDFQSSFVRQPMDLEFIVDRSVDRLRRFWGEDRAEDLDMILTTAEEARQEIQTLLDNEEQSGDSWGPIGGDFHDHNVHFAENNEPTFFNFDLCGPGWRAYDIAAFLLNSNLIHGSSNLSEAFFAGYYSVRQLSRNEHEAISPFMTLRRIWLTGSFTMGQGLAGHTFVGPV
jgi:Ser/Thr protein kinase RdoA (MazF antagonist)